MTTASMTRASMMLLAGPSPFTSHHGSLPPRFAGSSRRRQLDDEGAAAAGAWFVSRRATVVCGYLFY